MSPKAPEDLWQKLLNFISLWLVYPFARIVFAYNKIKWKNGWRLYGIPIIQKHRLSTIKLGNYLNLRSTVRSNPLGLNHPVILCTWQVVQSWSIGDHFGMSGGLNLRISANYHWGSCGCGRKYHHYRHRFPSLERRAVQA